MTVSLSCSFWHSCTKSVQLHISACEMAPNTKRREESEKENVDPLQGGRTVMVRSPWDCRNITASYPCDFMGIAWAQCGNLVIAARGPYDYHKSLQSSYDFFFFLPK